MRFQEEVLKLFIGEIQEKAFEEMKGISGAVVMIDCINGGVNCLVSSLIQQ